MTPLLEYTIKVSLIVLAGLGASVMLRRQSAAGRHWVLSMALISALTLPIIGSALPAWSAWTVSLGSAPATMRPNGNLASGARGGGAVTLPSASATTSLQVEKPATSATIAGLAPLAWIVGTALSVFILVVGLARLTWLSSRARPVTDPTWTRVLAETAQRYSLRRPVRVLQTEHPSLLVTWGAFRPRVIVPRVALDWPEDRVRVVLSHELAHIRRGDWIIQIASELLRSIYWFNPLLWIACRSLRHESEEACDNEVIAGGVDGSDYAEHLLEAARALKRDGARWLPAPAIVRPSSLERRIRVMLNTGLTRRPATRAFRIAAAISLLGATTLVAAAQMGPATVSGTVVDPSGAPVPGVTVRLASKNNSAKFEVETDASGRFQFVPLPADEYVLSGRLEGFKEIEEPVRLAGKPIRHDVKLALGTLRETISISGGPSDGVAGDVSARAQPRQEIVVGGQCRPSSVGGNLKAPRKVKDVKPIYPENLKAGGVGGTVILTATIGPDGKVATVDVIRSVHPDLDAAAIEAVRQWQFTPTLLNCEATDVAMTVSLNFSPK